MEIAAVALMGRASLTRDGVHPVAAVARGLGLELAVVPIEEEALVTGHTVLLRPGIDASRARYLCGREIGRWWLRRWEGSEPTEDACRRLAGAILCPRDAYLEDVCDCGGDVPELARRYGVPEALALLRLGEVTGRVVALVDRGLVTVRGSLRGRLRRVELRGDPRYGLISRAGGVSG